ncbi:hypothetical protein AQUCO_01200252v1 [Aquilegia coerulea]|uniref:Uncharacterized protein n=1 Tax=Aquilegia coerulea TaxID=218851 RepID=A0A2G5E523_AQUCA|nr:hypothetical protein AQUCO_01200252v1 [Aquilegia coerulea]
MSTKKKAFSGSTMTLKDFHGGSIPSDLPLPSAPGVVVRPVSSSSDHRQIPNAWTNTNRSDLVHHQQLHHHRSRPGSSGSINNRSNISGNNNSSFSSNNYDEKGSFFSHSSHNIGRNFDEDERKPLDGLSLPRRTVSDENSSNNNVRGGGGVVLPTSMTMTKTDSSSLSSSGRFNGRSVTSQQQMVGGGSGSGGGVYSGRFAGSTPVSSGGSGQSTSVPNAWGTKKEVVSVVEPVNHSNWSGPNAVSRFAQASALEKVSSGRWQTKPPVIHQPDVEIIRYSDDSDFHAAKDNYSYNEVGLMNEKADFDIVSGRFVEKCQIVEDEVNGAGGKGYLYQERARSPMYSEAGERNLSFHRDVVRPTSTDGKLDGSYTQPPMRTEVVERPKIKLLPRTKPLENLEAPIMNYAQVHQPPSHSTHVETSNEVYANENLSKPGSAGSEGDKRVVERPRLNLKPRSQPLEQADAIAERERKALFGDARPRELVLKERGVDDVVINSLDVIQPPNRPKQSWRP